MFINFVLARVVIKAKRNAKSCHTLNFADYCHCDTGSDFGSCFGPIISPYLVI